jgi:hypothetical protein
MGFPWGWEDDNSGGVRLTVVKAPEKDKKKNGQ